MSPWNYSSGRTFAATSWPALSWAAANDCYSAGYACTPGYSGGNASSTWAWNYYGGSWASTPNGYHNCTLYAAWRLAQNGMPDPHVSWGNADTWAGRIGNGDHLLQLGAPCVEPATVEDGGRGQWRRRRVVDDTSVAAAVRAVPAATGADPVDDMRAEQLDPAFGQRRGQPGGEVAVLLVAHGAGRPFGVDHHRDRGVWFGRRRHLGDMPDRIEQFRRKINAHNATHLATVDRHEDEGFLGHKAEYRGQRRDEGTGPVERKVVLRCCHAHTVTTGTVASAHPGGAPDAGWG